MFTTTELPPVEQKQTTPVAALAAKPQSYLDLAVVGSCRTPLSALEYSKHRFVTATASHHFKSAFGVTDTTHVSDNF